ncbi:hypothetical protein M601_005765 [Cellulophaga baltica 4]|nr:hypothetical protein M601_005765 [Cellulophaga baltica 4]
MKNYLVLITLVIHFISFGQEKAKLIELKSQLFDLDTISYIQVKGTNGTEINFSREDFEIEEHKKITLELKEYINSAHFAYINVTSNGQKINLKNNRKIPLNISPKHRRKSEIYYSEISENHKMNWTKLPFYAGVISFDSEWQIDVLKAVKKDSLQYYKYTDIDGNEQDSILYNFMIDRLGWFKFE